MMANIVVKIYGLLLCLYPRSFRRRFGEAMAGVFAEALEEKNTPAIVALTSWAIVDLVVSATSEHACRLTARIGHTAQQTPDYRLRVVWTPAILSTTLAMILLELSNGFSPTVLLRGVPLPVNWHWLLSLPPVGALGAYLSRRAGGKVWERILVVFSPALGLCAFALAFLLSVVAARSLAHFRPAIFAICFLSWGILPAFALLLGTLPFLSKAGSRDTVKPNHH
jgi:hypothetical protein